MNWNKYPFVRMVAALALGIVIADQVGDCHMGQPLLIGGLVLLILFLAVLHRRLKAFRYRWIFGVVTLVAFIWLGFARVPGNPKGRLATGSGAGTSRRTRKDGQGIA